MNGGADVVLLKTSDVEDHLYSSQLTILKKELSTLLSISTYSSPKRLLRRFVMMWRQGEG